MGGFLELAVARMGQRLATLAWLLFAYFFRFGPTYRVRVDGPDSEAVCVFPQLLARAVSIFCCPWGSHWGRTGTRDKESCMGFARNDWD